MRDNREISSELIFDLARLLRKYPPETWGALAAALRDPKTLDRLVYFASRMDTLSKHLNGTRHHLAPSGQRAEEDLERAVLIRQLRTDLVKKPLAQLRDVAYSLSVKIVESEGKPGLVSRILQGFQDLPSAELKKRLPRHLMHSSKNSEEYERWVSLIMGKNAK